MKALCIDADPVSAKRLNRLFGRAEAIIESVASYKEAYRRLINYDYDIVVLEPALADGEGLHLLAPIHRNSPQTGIFVLSTRSTPEERVQGLEAGADDYLAKPGYDQEIRARIRAILRRRSGLHYQKALHLGRMIIKLDERSVRIDEQYVRLTKIEYDILLYLARNKNRIVTKESLAEYIWGNYAEEATSYDFLYAHLKNLRKKLAGCQAQGFVKTVYGVGYKFNEHA